ncbi:hypothetical protein VTH82DRAFT_5664 [Thermothelomyces myriococcoides]
MVERDELESLLKTGSWRTSRSRSPRPYDLQRREYDTLKTRSSITRVAELSSRTKRPLAAFVEDEEVSLAREHGSVVSTSLDEEPKHRGDIDQTPIVQLVHEHNPERRFVIVPGATVEDAPKTRQARYEANTCRKYVVVSSSKGTEKEECDNKETPGQRRPKKDSLGSGDGLDRQGARPDIPRRKSHQDLPRLNTNINHEEPPTCQSSSRRGRDRPLVHQDPREDQDPREYSSARDRPSARPSERDFLSPSGGVQSTKRGRYRVYSDVRSEGGSRSARSPPARKEAEIEVSERRRSRRSSRYSANPSVHRRASSTTNLPNRDESPVEEQKTLFPLSGYGDPDEIFAFMSPGDDFMTGKPNQDRSPPRRPRSVYSLPHPRGAREMPGASPSRRRPPRPTNRDYDGYSSDDSYKERRFNRAERPYSEQPGIEPDYGPSISTDEEQGQNPGLGAVPPLAAPAQDEALQSGARSATFPTDKSRRAGERSTSPSSTTSASPSRRQHKSSMSSLRGAQSWDVSAGSKPVGSASLLPTAPGPLPHAATLDRPPAVNLVRQESSDPKSPTLYWHSNRSTEPDAGYEGDDGLTSHALAQLPECPWKKLPTTTRNRAGSDQFLALKRAENFRICPDCYRSLFVNTEFRHMFVAAPVRSGDQMPSCDFGTSPWYRIAYLMTLKYGYPDLRLLQGIASVAARSQACAGSQIASRVWYSMMAPNSRRPISTFNVCLGCAKMIEVLLPNLVGVFVPLDSHEATRGVCDLYFAPDRKRFFDYFEEMKTASDKALARRTAPDVVELVDRIREISIHDECLRNTPIANRRWHVLQRVPEFTVCEECFNAVVWPMIEDVDNGSEVPRNFYKYKQPKPVASCQLYSDRMRRVFLEACKHDDFEFLERCVLHRLQALSDIKTRYNELQREDQDDPAVQDELTALARQFKEVE